jgi:hypothetical protein
MMKKTIATFIDRTLIDEYASKDLHNGYALEVSELTQSDKSHFLDLLIAQDESLRELVEEHMQCLIDERCSAMEYRARCDSDVFATIDGNTGDVSYSQGSFV